jgi:hypothetical protein
MWALVVRLDCVSSLWTLYGGHCVSVWTAFVYCEHLMGALCFRLDCVCLLWTLYGGIVFPIGLRLFTVNILWGIVCPNGLRLMSANILWRHCVSDCTAFVYCEHFMGGIVCPTGLRLFTVNTLWGALCVRLDCVYLLWALYGELCFRLDCVCLLEHFMGTLCVRLDCFCLLWTLYGGIVCPTGLRLMTVNILWGHCLSDWSMYYYYYVYVLFLSIYSYCLFMYLHRTSWHSPATLTEVFPCFFLSCKANARV